MKLKSNIYSILISALLGGIIGYLGGPVVVLVPWALIGLLIGIYSFGRKSALTNGAAYGFTIAYVFMLVGYQGAAPLASRLEPFLVLGFVGAICGLSLAIIGEIGREYKARPTKE